MEQILSCQVIRYLRCADGSEFGQPLQAAAGNECNRSRNSHTTGRAIAASERIRSHLIGNDDAVAQGQLEALGGTMDLLPVTAPGA
ncbi:hypothetical protein [Streptomyces decoyicus]|uniref:Uncharacterized protein n=1 Tax=Streptomyces decoyicus TaxID=249567 RepID=A0ABZ1FWR2_9ACTN|nr:hypothetical protein [Streptomyces decoyicus]WSB74314.1 hypothetical protein OG863_10020 [Streptomyces decoyicus]